MGWLKKKFKKIKKIATRAGAAYLTGGASEIARAAGGSSGQILNAGANLLGIGSGSALKKGNTNASRAVEEARNNALGSIDAAYTDQQNYLNPYLKQGGAAYSRMGDLLGLSGNTSAAGYGTYGPGSQYTMTEMEQDPGYKFRLAQGQRALDNSVAARGMNLSGAQLKGAADYNSGMASQEYGNAYNRYMDRYKTLSDMAESGSGAANKLASYAGTRGASRADIYTGAGDSRANLASQRGKIKADIIGGYGGAIEEASGKGWFSS